MNATLRTPTAMVRALYLALAIILALGLNACADDPGGVGDPTDVGVDEGLDSDTDTDEPDSDADETDTDEPDVDVPDTDTDTDTDTEPPPRTCPTVDLNFGQEIEADGVWQQAQLSRCADSAHVVVVPRGTTWRIEVRNVPRDTVIEAYGAHFLTDRENAPILATSEPSALGAMLSFDFTAQYGGEQVLQLLSGAPQFATNYEIRASCVANCDRYTTRFPIALMHGFFGFENYFGLTEYWNGIVDPMLDLGTEVFTPFADAINNPVNRANQQLDNLEAIYEETGARKLNLIGHSQGGLDSRLIASPGGLDQGERIASITTVATPHRGVPVPLLDFLSDAVNLIVDFPNFSAQEAAAFNDSYPDSNDVTYYSWSAASCAAIDIFCRDDTDGEVIDTFLSVTHGILLVADGPNDGLVTVNSARWGVHLGTLAADHLDEIGQLFDSPNDGEPFNHVDFYIEELFRLRAAGF